MKLSEAIEEVSHKDYPNLTVLTIKKKEAIELLVEAGKRIQHDRIVNDDLNPYPLPGETLE